MVNFIQFLLITVGLIYSKELLKIKLPKIFITYFSPDYTWIIPFFIFLLVVVVIPELIQKIFIKPKRKTKSKYSASNKALSKPKENNNNRNQHSKRTDKEIMDDKIDNLSGEEFERLMEMYYKDNGYTVKRIGGSGDHGVDLILSGKENYKIAVQCKRHKGSIGNDVILKLGSGKRVHGCLDAWVITTSYFTPKATEGAKPLNITLINGIQVDDMLRTWKKSKMKKVL